ncbi:hypothetical protein GW17_00035436 [Ensete ventricosum]|nr:hypothetical protein GW17_00035436 [Ensete ventricosum]
MVSAEKEEGEKEIEEEDPTSLSLNNLDPSPPSFAKISPPPCLRRRGDDFSFAWGEEASTTSPMLGGEERFLVPRGEKN